MYLIALSWTDDCRRSIMGDDEKTLSEYGIKDGDFVVIERRRQFGMTAAKAEGDLGRRGFSLLHHEKNRVRAPAGQRPICSDASSPPAPNLTVRPLPSSSERPDIQLKLVSVSRYSTVSGGLVWAELD